VFHSHILLLHLVLVSSCYESVGANPVPPRLFGVPT
jgi:hypothetical protein